MKRLLSVLLALMLCLAPALSLQTWASESYEKDSISLATKIKKVSGEGDIVLDLSTDELTAAGFTVGDEVKVEFKDYGYSQKMPFFVTDSDSKKKEDALISDGSSVMLSRSMGEYASACGIFKSAVDSYGDTVWTDKKGASGKGSVVVIYLHEKGTYLYQYQMRNPQRSNDRDDYSTSARYANFREIDAGNIREGVLYRSSSPINNVLNRADYAAEKMEKAGVKTVINLSDNERKARDYLEDSQNEYYNSLFKAGNVICLNLNYDFESYEFKKGIGAAVRFMATHEGPYLIHCTEGKDRTGFLCALLESMMGASVSEMTDDYMLTYRNFYNYEKDSDQFDYTKKNYLKEIFRDIAQVKNNSELKNVDFHKAALDFLSANGVTEDELEQLQNKLMDRNSAVKEIPVIRVDRTKADEKGRVDMGLQRESVASYSGKLIKPGVNTLVVNGVYMYNGRDYKASYKNNRHAGQMKVTYTFKARTALAGAGIKKITLGCTITPKKVTAADIKIKLNKKETAVKFIKDLDRDAKIKKNFYRVDIRQRKVYFTGDYSGTVSF